MEDLHTMVESLKRDNKSKEHELLSREMRLQQLETELHTTEAGYNHVKAKCAETRYLMLNNVQILFLYTVPINVKAPRYQAV